MIRVLFVCLGNICRSPMAEAVFVHLVREVGLQDRIEADSAGTGSWHIDAAPHPGTMAMLKQHSIAYEGRGRQIRRSDLDEFDYVIVMDESNLRDVRFLHGQGRAHIARLLDYAPHLKRREVPDPYFEGGFEETYELVRAGAEGLLQAIRREHGL